MPCSDSCSYTTVKLARIQNCKLGVLHYSFMGGIMIYIVLIKVIMQTGYLHEEAPIGTVQMELQAPVSNACSTEAGVVHKLCQAGYPNNVDAFTKNLSTLAYCTDKPEKVKDCSKPGGRCLCQKHKAVSLVYPPTNAPPFMITTRITEWSEHRCNGGDCLSEFEMNAKNSNTQAGTNACRKKCQYNARYGGCSILDNCWDQSRYYTADVERFTLAIAHSVQTATLVDVAGVSKYLQGHLRTCSGDTIKPNVSLYKDDIFTIDTLLQAAEFPDKSCGVDLDALSNEDHKNSVRYNGFILMIVISYSNFEQWVGVSDITYEYTVKVVKASQAKVYQVITNGTDLDQQRVVDRHGIQIVVVQAGSLAQFEATTLLILLTSSLALLAASTTLVDATMLYVLADKKKFQETKYDDVVVDATTASPRWERTVRDVMASNRGIIDSDTLLHAGRNLQARQQS